MAEDDSMLCRRLLLEVAVLELAKEQLIDRIQSIQSELVGGKRKIDDVDHVEYNQSKRLKSNDIEFDTHVERINATSENIDAIADMLMMPIEDAKSLVNHDVSHVPISTDVIELLGVSSGVLPDTVKTEVKVENLQSATCVVRVEEAEDLSRAMVVYEEKVVVVYDPKIEAMEIRNARNQLIATIRQHHQTEVSARIELQMSLISKIEKADVMLEDLDLDDAKRAKIKENIDIWTQRLNAQAEENVKFSSNLANAEQKIELERETLIQSANSNAETERIKLDALKRDGYITSVGKVVSIANKSVAEWVGYDRMTDVAVKFSTSLGETVVGYAPEGLRTGMTAVITHTMGATTAAYTTGIGLASSGLQVASNSIWSAGTSALSLLTGGKPDIQSFVNQTLDKDTKRLIKHLMRRKNKLTCIMHILIIELTLLTKPKPMTRKNSIKRISGKPQREHAKATTDASIDNIMKSMGI